MLRFFPLVIVLVTAMFAASLALIATSYLFLGRASEQAPPPLPRAPARIPDGSNLPVCPLTRPNPNSRLGHPHGNHDPTLHCSGRGRAEGGSDRECARRSIPIPIPNPQPPTPISTHVLLSPTSPPTQTLAPRHAASHP